MYDDGVDDAWGKKSKGWYARKGSRTLDAQQAELASRVGTGQLPDGVNDKNDKVILLV